jgi:hypothetical protein
MSDPISSSRLPCGEAPPSSRDVVSDRDLVAYLHALAGGAGPAIDHGDAETSFTVFGVGVHIDRLGTPRTRARASRAIRALPALVHALLLAERPAGPSPARCACCRHAHDGHAPRCELDAALSDVGLCSRTSREYARTVLAERFGRR